MIWRAFGNTPNYVEPFAGSLAVLLARPSTPKVETVNDKDGFISNFWRAVQHAPDEVARWCNWPVNEADLHARHRWLVDRSMPLYDQLVENPDYFDPQIAGWWVWGVCTWIGNGWCHKDERVQKQKRRPELNAANGRGVHAATHKTRPDLRSPNGRGIHTVKPKTSSAGQGVHALSLQIPKIGVPGNGIHAPTFEIHKKMPQPRKYPPGQTPPTGKKPGTARAKGVHRDGAPYDIFEQLSERLRRVRVCCGDWTRVLGRSTLGIDTAHGMTPCGVVLDPPYAHELRDKRLYREDAAGVSDAVREWALANGNNPALRIALCGQVGEHKMPSDWTEVAWASTSSAQSRSRERIWFSPFCNAALAQVEMFGSIEAT